MELVPARRVDEDLDRAKLALGAGDGFVDRVAVGHVEVNRERGLVGRAVGDVAGHDAVAVRCQRAHDRAADTSRSARDQGHAGCLSGTRHRHDRIESARNTMVPVGRFGPAGLPSALLLTIDNLGEARALERGMQPADAPVGSDPSVTRALPWLLDELGSHGLRATFFVEAINCELYPDAVREIAARGHEVGLHGWRHEQWTSLSGRKSATCSRAASTRSPRSGSTREGFGRPAVS